MTVGVLNHQCCLCSWVVACTSVTENVIAPISSQLILHYAEFFLLVLDSNETHMGTQAPSSADCVKTQHTKLLSFQEK